MGDDLYIAREFSNAALADISAIGAMEQRQNSANIAQMSIKLAHMQSGAKRLRARAIYQSAQSVIDGLTPNALSQDSFDMRLSALSNLVTQYADGLSEIEAAQERDRLAAAETGQPIEVALPTELGALPSSEDLRITAKAMLAELMPLTRDGETFALQALMDYDPQAEPVALMAEPVIETRPIQTQQIPLEYVLRDAIQDALSIARMSGKTISISYDVGQTHIDQTHINSLELRLCEGLRALILQSLPQDGMGHIDINLRGDDMVICSRHALPRLLPQGLTSRETDRGCEIIFALVAKQNIDAKSPLAGVTSKSEAIFDPDNIDVQTTEANDAPTLDAPVLAAPMITAKTEGQLRAQLSALLDSQDTSQAAAQSRAVDGLHLEDNIIVMTDEAAKTAQQDKQDAGEMGASL